MSEICNPLALEYVENFTWCKGDPNRRLHVIEYSIPLKLVIHHLQSPPVSDLLYLLISCKIAIESIHRYPFETTSSHINNSQIGTVEEFHQKL